MNELFKPPNNPRIGLLLSGFYKWGNRQGDWRACNGARIWWGVQYSCLENAMDGGAWWAAVHGVWKSQTQLSHFTFTFHFHALVKEMTTHSSILAWRIPGMVEPHGLPSVGSQSRTWLSDFTFTFHFHALEKEMATHSTGEHGGLPSMGSHIVRHDRSDLAAC